MKKKFILSMLNNDEGAVAGAKLYSLDDVGGESKELCEWCLPDGLTSEVVDEVKNRAVQECPIKYDEIEIVINRVPVVEPHLIMFQCGVTKG